MNLEVGKEANNHEDKANSKLPSESIKQLFSNLRGGSRYASHLWLM